MCRTQIQCSLVKSVGQAGGGTGPRRWRRPAPPLASPPCGWEPAHRYACAWAEQWKHESLIWARRTSDTAPPQVHAPCHTHTPPITPQGKRHFQNYTHSYRTPIYMRDGSTATHTLSWSPCWRARCPGGSSRGPRPSWTPATTRRAQRSPQADPPPRTWTSVLEISERGTERIGNCLPVHIYLTLSQVLLEILFTLTRSYYGYTYVDIKYIECRL